MSAISIKQCLACQSYLGHLSTAVDVRDQTTRSGKLLVDVVREMCGTKSTGGSLCKKCHKLCVEYDGMKNRLEQIKQEFQTTYRKSNSPSPAKGLQKILVPASKLQPLPPQYVIVNRASLANLSGVTGKSPTSSLLLQSPQKITNTFTIQQATPKKTQSSAKTSLAEEIASITNITTSETETSQSFSTILSGNESILNFNMNNLPKNFLDNAVVTKLEAGARSDGENKDEQPMEIDEDCSFATQKKVNDALSKVLAEHLQQQQENEQSKDQKENVFDISILSNLEQDQSDEVNVDTTDDHDNDNDNDDDNDNEHGNFVVDKVEILDADEELDGDEDESILMQGSDGSVIRVVTGQKFLYGGSEMSLIIPQSETEDTAGDDDEERQPDCQDQDSNDESQIELQVSGDEETANAIIAAAREQGGAFIKVQSGAMYRVKSVKSKMADDDEDPLALHNYDAVETTEAMVEKVGSEYKCMICDKLEFKIEDKRARKGKRFTMGDLSAITAHMKMSHGARVHICPVCAHVSSTRTLFNLHTATHGDEYTPTTMQTKKGYPCTRCLKKCGSQNLLKEHMNLHNGDKPYECDKCSKAFASKYTHQAHMKTHMERPRSFACAQCSKTFYTQQNLTQHEKTHVGVKEFVCKDCGKAFATQHNLEVHGVVHSGIKPFMCGVCGKGFARKAEIRDHIRIHTGERPFACNICGATFAQRSNLQSHVKATHTRDRRHSCQHCEKRFKRRRLLEYHIKSCHTGERPFKCTICGASFVYPEHYKKHAWIHSGEKPFVCEVCGKKFNSRDNRNAHRFVHSDKKPYECLVCGAGYMRKPLLYAHMNTSGHMTESIVVNQPRVSVEVDGDPVYVADVEDLDSTKSTIASVSVPSATDDDSSSNVFYSTAGDKQVFLQDETLVESSEKIDASLLETITSEELDKSAQLVASNEDGAMVRLVQIQLPNGTDGWIAIN